MSFSPSPRRSSPRRAAHLLGAAAVGTALLTAGGGVQAASAAPVDGIWSNAARPAHQSVLTSRSTTLGVEFSSSSTGAVTGIQYYGTTANAGPHIGKLWSSSGKVLAQVSFPADSTSGWHTATLSSPVAIKPGVKYVASYTAPRGHYAADGHALGRGKRAVNGPLTAYRGLISSGDSFPTGTVGNTNYYVDVVFTTAAVAPATTSPSTPAANTSGSTDDPMASAPAATTVPAAETPDTAPAAATRPATTGSAPTGSNGTTVATTPKTTKTTSSTASTPAATATTTGTSSGSTSGKPGASNTGVIAGSTLTASGGLTISKDGTVIDSLDISGSVTITAKNVVIKNSRIHGTGNWGVYVRSGGTATIQDTEIYGFDNGLIGDNWTARRINIHDVLDDGVKIGNNITLEDSWIHNLTPEAGAHADGAQVQTGVVNAVIRHNFIDATTKGTNSALFVAPDLGPSSNGPLTIDGNWLDGGGYTLYIVDGNNGQYFINTIIATNNRFGSHAKYGPINRNVPITQSGNVWDSTGAALAL